MCRYENFVFLKNRYSMFKKGVDYFVVQHIFDGCRSAILF